MYSTMSFSICELVDMKRDRHVLITPLTALSQTLRACACIAILVVSTIHVCHGGLCLKIITGR